MAESAFNLRLRDSLDNLATNHLERKLKVLTGEQGPWVEMDGRRLLNLSSNNYLGLAAHPRVKETAARAARLYGCGSGASRLLCGNMALHRELEERLAVFKGKEAALVYSSGYAANVGALSCLVGRGDSVFSDELNHASIIDGCRLSRAKTEVYPHKDLAALEAGLRRALAEAPQARRLIVVDGVFSMDGDIAPLPGLVDLAEKYRAILMVDEAHATGTFGPGGRGVAAHFGLEDRVPIIMGTLSKALGSLGGFIAGSADLVRFLTNHSRSFIFSTALPPPAASAALEALNILEEDPSLAETLQARAAYLREGLHRLGFNTLRSETQIIPVLIGGPAPTMEQAGRLLQEGVLVSALRPPTVPKGTSRLRLSVMANHTLEDLNFALAAIGKAGREEGL
ncbi:MAG: 8-amino-7-oxononanoate synthase [Chloroflexi bacterium]|nr:8-amino-7-oxononanoate synthase [Chloroflexota bacterium]